VDGSAKALQGVALGWESLVRGAGGQGLGATAAARLTELTAGGGDPAMAASHARVRALAYATLGQARRADRTLLARMLDDPDPFVRLLAGRYLDGATPEQRPELIRRLLMDHTAAVTIEGFLRLAGEPRTALYCRYLLAGASSATAAPIRVVALDGLARPCPDRGPQIDTLTAVAGSIAGAPADGWQPAAHALTSLARVAPAAAEPLLPAYAGHADPFVRAYAARAAATLRDRATLRSLAADETANVRTAAIEGLADLDGHLVDDLLLAQLSNDDPQLLITAARLLEGSRLGAAATTRLMDALERVSAAERETWRDSRRALLERIAELGDASLAPRLEPYLTDYDASIATQVAALLAEWTGRSHVAALRALPREPVPTPAEYRALDGARVVLSMRGGGEIVIELWPFLATTNVVRFARLAEEGWFDGLTFHRWAPNFVIQGGSPGANEFQGAGRYSRDEVGLRSHWRGTVGISTRGRDTGDAQIFVNLVDNVRLDHDYTIVGTVVEGMDVVDAVLEGAVIERAELVSR
jgi:cyclophilin family peptidyl-prolyl cis-trans isomerase/HEAT repeat protein